MSVDVDVGVDVQDVVTERIYQENQGYSGKRSSYVGSAFKIFLQGKCYK